MPLLKSDSSTIPANSFAIPAAGTLVGTLKFPIFENTGSTDVKDMKALIQIVNSLTATM